MILTKEIRCPKCNAQLDSGGLVLSSNPPYDAVKCSSNLCDWKGYTHEYKLLDNEFNVVDKL